MNYEVGKQYEMKVVDIRKDSAGHDYITLHDDDPSKEYRVYNILKCQYESPDFSRNRLQKYKHYFYFATD